MSQEIFRHLREDKTEIKEIIICLFDKEAFNVFNKGVVSYLEHIVNKLQQGPFSTVDALIEIPASPAGGDGGIVVIERSNPPFGLALPGGFVDYGESLEHAVIREVKEETNLDVVELRQFHTYSDPKRDPRFHTIGTAFIAKVKGNPRAGDDAAGLKIIKKSEIEKLDFAFDHKKILLDYLKEVKLRKK
ncbi:MAG: NUDIX hydrolase [Candidatus Omnitrophica bacterium]|nr:NUDIX hydrolase [Candidatus Omnitrophota bacterium]